MLIKKIIKSESYLLRIQNIVVKQVLYPVDNCKGRYFSSCGIATDIFTVHCRHSVFLHSPVCGEITIPASVTNPYSKGQRNKLSKEGFFFRVEDPKIFMRARIQIQPFLWIRIPLFTLIWVRSLVQLNFKVIGLCDHWPIPVRPLF